MFLVKPKLIENQSANEQEKAQYYSQAKAPLLIEYQVKALLLFYESTTLFTERYSIHIPTSGYWTFSILFDNLN